MQQVLHEHSTQAPVRRSHTPPYEAIVDLIDEVVFRTDETGSWTFLSRAWTTVTGFAVAASIGRRLSDVVHSSDAQLYADTITPLLHGDAASAHEHIRVVTAHGAVRWIVLRVRVERETTGKVLGLCGTLYDITERKAEGVRREEQVRASQKMEAIGRLAGGISHDFNNLLTVILSYAQLIEEAVGVNGVVSADVLELRRASERAGELTRQLLAYSRQQLLKPTTLDLDRVVSDMGTMLRRVIGEDIALTLVPGPRAATVRADAGQIEQVIVNLAVNARDAMPSGGTLTITAKPVVLRGKASEEGLNGDFVAIRVADTGSGIPADVLPRVFEPFFTTKDVGKGTGLGLSQVYGFAHQSGGAATIASSARRGTVVTLFLPRTWEAPAQPQEQSAVVGPKRHAGTVLLVEDNAEVAEVGKAYLEELGYKVKQAASAQAGLDFVERERDIDVVFSDILMPGGMNGLELADAIRQRFPHVIVLLTTGYSSSAQDAVRQGFAVLQKPYDLAALDRALREAQRAEAPKPQAAVG